MSDCAKHFISSREYGGNLSSWFSSFSSIDWVNTLGKILTLVDRSLVDTTIILLRSNATKTATSDFQILPCFIPNEYCVVLWRSTTGLNDVLTSTVNKFPSGVLHQRSTSSRSTLSAYIPNDSNLLATR